MRTLISFSGGTNSTYGLHRLLTETDDEIIAVRFHEPASNTPEQDAEADVRAQAIVDWLRANVRDFQYEFFTPTATYTRELKPIRPGFRWTVDYGVIKRRYRSMREAIQNYAPDRFASGLALENTSTDRFAEHYSILRVKGVPVFLTSAPTLDPLPTPAYLDYDAVAATLSGRFHQRAALPTQLLALMPNCPKAGKPGHELDTYPLCWTCCATAIEAGQSGMSPDQLDDYFAQHGYYGAYRKNADPDSAGWRGAGAALALELLGIPIKPDAQ